MHFIDKSKVRKQMKKKGFKNQVELANSLGITKNQLSKILSIDYDFLKSNIRELCNLLEIDIIDIISKKPKDQCNLEKNQNSLLPIFITSENFIDTSKVTAQNKYNVVEFFAGAGGLALGLERSGFNTVFLNEFDKDAVATLTFNRPKWNIVEDDICNIVKNGVKNYLPPNIEIDLISGGYPCQAFSYAGKGLGLEDARGTLFYPFAKAIEELQPKMFLAENVKGLTTHDNGNTLKTMIEVYESLGYSVQYKILNALNYGVAQKRERVVIVGIRKDLKELYNLEYQFPKPYDQTYTLRDVLIDVPKSECPSYSEKKFAVLDLVPPGGCWRDLPDEIAKEYMGASYYLGGGKTGMARRLSWNEPGLTILCSPSQKQTERCHPDETRPFSVRENARIQSFPDEWEFKGSVASKYKQIGNAVPVNFAEAIGKSIINTLNKII